MDGNFKLNRKDVSSEEADPSHLFDWAFFVDNCAYKKHLEEYDADAIAVAQAVSNGYILSILTRT